MADDCFPLCVLGAMGFELQGVGRLLGGLEALPELHGCRRGRFAGRDVYLVRTGVGAASGPAATAALAVLRPGSLICAGIAGGLMEALSVGDVVFCESVESDASGSSSLPAAGSLVESALAAGLARGRCITVSAPLLTPGAKAAAASSGATVCDMEAWHAARAARGVPFLAVKAVSDALNDRLPDATRFLDSQGRVRGGRAALHFASHPADAVRAFRFASNARRAVRSLSEALGRVLEVLARGPAGPGWRAAPGKNT